MCGSWRGGKPVECGEGGREVKMRILLCDDMKTPQPSDSRKHNTSMEASRMHILYYTNIRMLKKGVKQSYGPTNPTIISLLTPVELVVPVAPWSP